MVTLEILLNSDGLDIPVTKYINLFCVTRNKLAAKQKSCHKNLIH